MNEIKNKRKNKYIEPYKAFELFYSDMTSKKDIDIKKYLDLINPNEHKNFIDAADMAISTYDNFKFKYLK